MEAQMEARMQAMGMKSPASPSARSFARQSVDPAHFLSPNSALYDNGDGAAATLAQQRAKLKSQPHRISAPGTLTSAAAALKSPLWSQAHSDQVAEHGRNARSPSPVPSDSGISGRGRPKSTGSDLSATGPGNSNFLRSPHASMLLEENGLSPMPGGSWASMVNTPVVPMFHRDDGTDGGAFANQPQSPNLDLASSRLGWGNSSSAAQQQQSGQQPSNIVLDDARKFRRTRLSDSGAQRPTASGLGQLPPMGSMGAMGSLGAPPSAASTNIGGVSFDPSGNFMMPPGGVGAQAGRRAVSGPSMQGGAGAARISGASTGGLNSSMQQQQAALAAQQSWRNNLLSASNNGSFSAGAAQTAFAQNANGAGGASPNLAAMAAGFGNMTPQDFSNLNLLVQQQQQQLQLQQNLISLGMGNMALSPNLNASAGANNLSAANQMAMAMGANAAAALLGGQSPGLGARRSPRASDRGLSGVKPGPVPGSGSNPDEQVDDSLLADVSHWLRSLRLHKCVPLNGS
jgi:hypothetical protein